MCAVLKRSARCQRNKQKRSVPGSGSIQNRSIHMKASWFFQTLKVSVRRYAKHPELMFPFLIQSFMGLGMSWVLTQTVVSGASRTEGVEVVLLLLLGLTGLMLQGWALRWCYDVLEGELNAGEALRATLRKWVSLLGVSFLVAFPGTALSLLLISLTSGWVMLVGTTLAATLVNWVTLFAITGVVVDQLRVWASVREAFLLLGVHAKNVIGIFTVLLVYGYLNGYFNSAGPLGSLIASDVSRVGNVLWLVFNVLLSPILYVLLVSFYRDHLKVAEEAPA